MGAILSDLSQCVGFKVTTVLYLHILLTAPDNLACARTNLPELSKHSYDLHIEQLRSRIQECRRERKNCWPNGKSDPMLPSRVIDVGALQEGIFPKLYQTQETERGRYTALSYCWGGDQSKTTLANFSNMKKKIEDGSLAKTIHDAIEVTRKLDIRYLWVDAICIIQDDEADRVKEIKMMCDIYKNATLAILASTSNRAQDGFLPTNETKGIRLPFYLSDGSLEPVTVLPCNVTGTPALPLDLRAWALQERMLVQRRAIFGHNEIGWQCTELQTTSLGSSLCQSKWKFPELPPLHELYSYQGKWSQLNVWGDIVCEYSQRMLTDHLDRLPAISGVIQHLESYWSETCMAGLWRKIFFISYIGLRL